VAEADALLLARPEPLGDEFVGRNRVPECGQVQLERLEPALHLVLRHDDDAGDVDRPEDDLPGGLGDHGGHDFRRVCLGEHFQLLWPEPAFDFGDYFGLDGLGPERRDGWGHTRLVLEIKKRLPVAGSTQGGGGTRSAPEANRHGSATDLKSFLAGLDETPIGADW
jgi:hypothetical protein